MKAEIRGKELLIYPETPTEKAAMVAFCNMYKDKVPTIITMDTLVKNLEELNGERPK